MMTETEQEERVKAVVERIMQLSADCDVHIAAYVGHIQSSPDGKKFKLHSQAISSLKPTTFGQLTCFIEKLEEHMSDILSDLCAHLKAAKQMVNEETGNAKQTH